MGDLRKLKRILKEMGSALIAYSGGADSTFLLKVAFDSLGSKVLAVTADSLTYPKEELAFAKKITRGLGVRHKIIRTKELKDRRFLDNPITRCYFCKSQLFKTLKEIAVKKRLKFIADASNLSDKLDFRPGDKAKKYFKVRSPLAEAGFSKEDIRSSSKSLGLVTWDKPSLACLASRIPYGQRITPALLKRINKGEYFLKNLGFKQLRLRHHNHLCRIEVPLQDIPALVKRRNLVVAGLKRLGYNYITLDLEGFRSGSLNEVIKK
ncbi:MAG: ATP-dependent sacrificial sulfur transferase LarE [bacterium]